MEHYHGWSRRAPLSGAILPCYIHADSRSVNGTSLHRASPIIIQASNNPAENCNRSAVPQPEPIAEDVGQKPKDVISKGKNQHATCLSCYRKALPYLMFLARFFV
ncbi:hypothetical protein GX48_01560 [Paracoccidioides brasiliensis]|nr:hypothetical protein GX48_01560 [Paracoccidioides brasiliensis]